MVTADEGGGVYLNQNILFVFLRPTKIVIEMCSAFCKSLLHDLEVFFLSSLISLQNVLETKWMLQFEHAYYTVTDRNESQKEEKPMCTYSIHMPNKYQYISSFILSLCVCVYVFLGWRARPTYCRLCYANCRLHTIEWVENVANYHSESFESVQFQFFFFRFYFVCLHRTRE